MSELDSWSPWLWLLLSLAFACLVAVSVVMAAVAGVVWVFKLPGRVLDWLGGGRDRRN